MAPDGRKEFLEDLYGEFFMLYFTINAIYPDIILPMIKCAPVADMRYVDESYVHGK